MRSFLILSILSINLLAVNFWESFDKVLKESVVYYNYSSIDGDFFHTAVNYKKIKK